jgi:hypothetical protein
LRHDATRDGMEGMQWYDDINIAQVFCFRNCATGDK